MALKLLIRGAIATHPQQRSPTIGPGVSEERDKQHGVGKEEERKSERPGKHAQPLRPRSPRLNEVVLRGGQAKRQRPGGSALEKRVRQDGIERRSEECENRNRGDGQAAEDNRGGDEGSYDMRPPPRHSPIVADRRLLARPAAGRCRARRSVFETIRPRELSPIFDHLGASRSSAGVNYGDSGGPVYSRSGGLRAHGIVSAMDASQTVMVYADIVNSLNATGTNLCMQTVC